MTATHTTTSTQRSQRPQPCLGTIVVATDFSANAAAALDWAVGLAKTHNAKVLVAHVIDTALPALTEAQGPIAEHVRRELETIRQTASASEVEVHTAFERGKPWEAISRISKDANADLIVMGAHGQSRFSERVLGTIADRLIKSTSIPVLVHRESKT